MSSVAADTLAAPASRPILDRKPSRTTLLLFLLLLLIGVGYSGYSLVSDISGVPAQRLTWLPFLLLGLALLIALGFEFVNGFHDTANAVATVIYTHSLPPHLAVLYSGASELPRCARLQRRGGLRHHHAVAGGAHPAGRQQRRLRHGIRAADRRNHLEPRHLVARSACVLVAYPDRLDHRRRRGQRPDARPRRHQRC